MPDTNESGGSLFVSGLLWLVFLVLLVVLPGDWPVIAYGRGLCILVLVVVGLVVLFNWLSPSAPPTPPVVLVADRTETEAKAQPCGTCGGSGQCRTEVANEGGVLVRPCAACHGRGVTPPPPTRKVNCRACDGTGRFDEELPRHEGTMIRPCPACEGAGVIMIP
ncbi:MAG TPA: hypothetical protein VD866_30080 [Urbifossiella sp.]|nr:hypothetical protein [Urbifossiella sp.]